MQLLPLLGKQLKDNDIIEFLDEFGMDVVYDFDRLHEGQPDKYWAASHDAGIQLKFGATQILNAIFLHIVPRDGFAAFSQPDCDVPVFAAPAEVQAFGETQRLQVSKGKADSLEIARDWVRLEFATHSVHYEFHGSSLAQITISRTER